LRGNIHPEGPDIHQQRDTSDTRIDTWVQTARGRLFARIWRTTEGRGLHDAAPIVLFPASLGAVELWRTFPAKLRESTGRTVIAYNRLGFGRSDPRHDELTPAFIQQESEVDFPAVRAQLGFDGFIAMGHSVGGAMAIHCAAAFPACRALITESAQSFAEDRTLSGIRAAELQFRDPLQFERLARYHGPNARWVLNAWTQTWLSPDFRSWSLAQVLPRVRCPALVIHGDDDEYGSVRHPQQIAGSVSGPAELHVLAQCGHVPHREKEQQVLDLITAFVGCAGASQ
jgi:pimeloyl-ACP methyl ester carboxylesterase